MKYLIYIITALSLGIMSCSSARTFTNSVEDDIYYVPGRKPLVVKEVENITGEKIDMGPSVQAIAAEPGSASTGSRTAPVINARKGTVENVNTGELLNEAQQRLATEGTINETIYENTGYWIGGYKGSENDLEEISRIINMYPEGFGYISNGQDIAMNLSFDPDWNVYTDNGRYWWFPSSSNINLYSSLLFGTYPKYIWTVVWNNPGYDSWAFNSGFNSGFSIGFNSGWNGFGFGFGWNSGFYNPWYNNWYGGGWYDPWWGGYRPGWGYYPNWHNHWHDHGWHNGHWGGGHYPNWGPPSYRPDRPNSNQRPNHGGIVGNRPNNGGIIGNGTVRPGSTTRPGSSNSGSSIRPGSTTTSRPDYSITRPGSVTRPGSTGTTTTRPGSIGTTRPGSTTTTRPGSTTTYPNVTRPGSTSTTRPGSTTTTRPGSTTTYPNVTRPGSTSTTRPGSTTTTRPGSTSSTRPGSVSPNQYTRPQSNSNIKTYTRPQSNTRPTYNNNSSSRYSGSSSSYSGSNSSYSGSSRSSYSGSSSSSGSSTRSSSSSSSSSQRGSSQSSGRR